MDTMQVNKVFAAVLVSGIAFFTAGRIGVILVPSNNLAKSVLVFQSEAPKLAEVAAAPRPIAVLLASANAETGAGGFKAAGCVACHSVNEGGKAGVGPNLWGVVGAKQAAHEGYVYSAALTGKGGNWTFDNLNTWLIKPAAYAPGTKMTYAGLPDDKKRADIIAYLRTLSTSPVPLPPVPADAAPTPVAANAPAAAPAPVTANAPAAAASADAAPAVDAAPAAAVPFVTLLASANADAGKASTAKLGCIACHSFVEGGKNGLGPNLYGVVGAPQAAHAGYTYSAALKAKEGPWSYDNLNAWLTKPSAYAAGTKMTYAGVADPQVRANVIAYLRTLSADPVPLPAP